MAPLFEHYSIQLRTPDAGRRTPDAGRRTPAGGLTFHAEDGKQALAGSYGLPGSVPSPHGL
jgi:hypothetical protein